MQGKDNLVKMGRATKEQHRIAEIINLVGNEWMSNQRNTEGSCTCLMHIRSSRIGTCYIALCKK